MRHKLEIGIPVIGLVVAAMISGSLAAGQNAAPPSLLEQLQAQYKFVKMGNDSTGPVVLEAGTVLGIQKGGILGVPSGSPKSCPSKYENGNLKPPSGWCTEARKQGIKHGLSALAPHLPGAAANAANGVNTDTSSTRYFKSGEKVYPSNIAVDATKGTISFGVVACDTCNKTDPPTYYNAVVIFQFAPGYLETADVSKVEDTIAEVFSIDNSSDAQQSQGAQGGQDQQVQQAQSQGQAQAPAPAQVASPVPPAPQAPAGPTLTNDDIVTQVKNKLADSLIITQIKKSACAFDTSTGGLVKLKQAGVSDAVMQAMVEKQ
jgi:hypothetical protein